MIHGRNFIDQSVKSNLKIYDNIRKPATSQKLKIKKFVKKLSSAIKNWNEVTLNISLNLIGSSNDETNFPDKLLLTNKQVSKIHQAFANGSSANIKLSKTQIF